MQYTSDSLFQRCISVINNMMHLFCPYSLNPIEKESLIDLQTVEFQTRLSFPPAGNLQMSGSEG